MRAAEAFFDTNVLLYLLSADAAKSERAEALLADGGQVSVQVLNEFAAVTSRKLRMTWDEIGELLSTVRRACRVEPLSIETHDRGLLIARRYGLALYDSMIVASALIAGCRTLYSEDLQAGQVFDRQLRVVDPFSTNG